MRKLLLAALAAISLTSPAIANDKVRLTYTSGPYAYHAWVMYGIEKGIFNKHGIDVDILGKGGGAHKSNLLLAAGKTDVVIADFASIVYVNGLQNKSVVKTFMIIDDRGQDVLVSKKKIDNLDDLNKMSLAANPNSTSAKLLKIVTDAKPKFVKVPINMKELLIFRGEVDAATGFDTRIIPAFKQLGFDVSKLNVLPLASRYPWTVSYVQATNTEWLEKNKDVVVRYTKASKEALAACIENKDACIQSLAKFGGKKIDVETETLRMDYWVPKYVHTDNVKKNGFSYDRTKDLEIYSDRISKALDVPVLGVDAHYVYIATN